MRYLVFFLTLFIISCGKYNFNSVVGKYRTKGGFEWGSNIELKNDSTFIYNWQGGLIYGETKGKWKFQENYLILRSDLQPEDDTLPKFYIVDKKNINLTGIEIELLYPDFAEPLAGANGYMYIGLDTLKTISDLEGKLKFPIKEFDSIQIQFIGIKDIIIKDTINDYFKIATVYGIEDIYEYFTDEIWKIRNNSLKIKKNGEIFYRIK